MIDLIVWLLKISNFVLIVRSLIVLIDLSWHCKYIYNRICSLLDLKYVMRELVSNGLMQSFLIPRFDLVESYKNICVVIVIESDRNCLVGLV